MYFSSSVRIACESVSLYRRSSMGLTPSKRPPAPPRPLAPRTGVPRHVLLELRPDRLRVGLLVPAIQHGDDPLEAAGPGVARLLAREVELQLLPAAAVQEDRERG